MLSISAPMKGAGKGDYYLELAKEDYYLHGGEPPGEWFGEAFNLKGEVQAEHFKSLLKGKHPFLDTKLVSNAEEKDRQSGWDLTFSAPKSVSIVWALGGKELGKAISEAHKEAVKEALRYIENEAGLSRKEGGLKGLEGARLQFALFEHGTSRELDPQLHTHAVLPNVGLRKDGTYGAIYTKEIFRLKMAAGALYRAELSYRLNKLGFETEKINSSFEISKVNTELIQHFSKRRKQVEEFLKSKGFSGAKAAEFATKESRVKKDFIPREQLYKSWQGQAEQFVSTNHVLGLRQKEPTNKKLPPDLMEKALKELTSKQSYFTASQLVRFLSEESQGYGISAKEVLKLTDKTLATNQEVLFLGKYKGQRVYSTKELVSLEKEMLSFAEESKSKALWNVDKERFFTISNKLALENQFYDEEKRRAANSLVTKKGQIQIISGFAGTGKSLAMKPVAEIYQEEGYQVIGLAPSGIAAASLGQSAKIECFTLHKFQSLFEAGEIKLNQKSVLILDEAAMVGTRQLYHLFELVRENNAKLILSGDEKQLQSVEAGGAFEALSVKLGKESLVSITRQRAKWARRAVIDFATGRTKRALDAFLKRKRIQIFDTREETKENLVNNWAKFGAENPKDNLIIATTNLEALEINQMAQARRKEHGLLSDKSMIVGENRIFEGDRVLFTKNMKSLGVKNGSLGFVTEVDELGYLRVALDEGSTVLIDLYKYGNIRLGYCITTHKSQGVTKSNVYVLAGGDMQDRELSYVQASRARGATFFYLDELSAGRDLKEAARKMNNSRQKLLASEIRNRAL